MKTFKYDVLVEKDDICDREYERKRLLDMCLKKRRGVVYARRRCGKTSLVKNVVAPLFCKKTGGIYLYADLYQVRSLEDISQRIQIGISQMMRSSFPLKNLAKSIGNYFRGTKTSITFDPLTGAPSFSLESGHDTTSIQPQLSELFLGIRRISEDRPLLIILDEFQSIAQVKQAEGVLRSELMACSKSAVILLGSKRHILKEIFSEPNKPFYNFGSDVEFKPIPWDEYATYIRERLDEKNIAIDDETIRYWLDIMHNIPNSINELGAWVTDHYSDLTLSKEIIHQCIMNIIDEREVRFSTILEGMSKKEITLLIALAKIGETEHLMGRDFAELSSLKVPTIQKTSADLLKRGMIEKEGSIISICDPLFAAFLKYRR